MKKYGSCRQRHSESSNGPPPAPNPRLPPTTGLTPRPPNMPSSVLGRSLRNRRRQANHQMLLRAKGARGPCQIRAGRQTPKRARPNEQTNLSARPPFSIRPSPSDLNYSFDRRGLQQQSAGHANSLVGGRVSRARSCESWDERGVHAPFWIAGRLATPAKYTTQSKPQHPATEGWIEEALMKLA